MILDSPFASGSLQVQNSITSSDGLLTGDLTVLGTINATIEGTTATASYVQLSNIDGSASLASDISNNTDNIGTLTDATSSYALKTQISGSFTDVSSSIAQDIANISTDFADITNKPTLLSGSQQIADDISGSFLLNTTDTLTGDLTVTGTVTAQEFHTEYISASVIYESGSTQFGDTLDDTHTFTGSINLTGSLNINGAEVGTGKLDETVFNSYTSSTDTRIDTLEASASSVAPLNNATSSYALKAQISGSFTDLSSSLEGRVSSNEGSVSSLNSATSSYALKNQISGSSTDLSSSIASDIEDILDGTDTVTSASYALTASYADSGAGFPFSGSAIITGSLLVSQSNVDFTSATGVSGSFSGSFVGDGSQLSGVTSYTDSDTLSYINSIGVVSGSAQVNSGSFSGSFEGDGSGLTGVVSEISEVATVTSTFTSATSITVNHNFSTQNVIVAVYDDSDNQVIPESVNVSNENSVVVTFPTAKSGTVVVAKGGHIVSGSAQDSDKLGGQPAAAYATTGSNTFIGNQTHSGSILPAVTNTYDLGSANFQWRDLFLSSGSLYIDGTQVISSDANTLTFTTDAGQSIKILETGGDDITFQTDTGNIELKGTVEVLSGKKIIDSAGTVIQFGDSLGITGSIDVSGTVDGIDLQIMSSSLATRIKNQEDFSGSLDATFATDAEIDDAVSSLNLATGSYALKTQISGSFTSLSSSLEDRISNQEDFSSSLDATFATDQEVSDAVSSLNASTSSYALKTQISGSFTSLSSSLEDRITDNEGSVSSLNSATSSYALKTQISGSFTSLSSSLEGRVSSNEGSVSSLNSATSSYALKTQISGSFTSLSSSIEQRFSDSEGSISSLNTATSSYLQNTTDTFTGTLTVSGSNTIKSSNPTLLLVQQGVVNQANSGRIVFAESPGNTAGHMIIRYDGSDDKIHFDSAIDGTSDLFTFSRSGDATVSGDLTVAGTVTAQEFHTEFVSSSIVFESGSTKFGDSSDDVHQMTGSLRVTGSGDHYFQNGSVGIGLSNPTEKLEVNGAVKITNVGAAQLILRGDSDNSGDAGQVDGIIDFLHDDALFGYRINTENYAGTSALNIQELINGSYTSRLYINNDGNVGLGTISPSGKLEVQTGYIISSGSGAAELGFVLDRAGLDTYQIRHLDGGLTIFNETDNRKEMTFLGNGRVGIGETSPDTILHVVKSGAGEQVITIFENSTNADETKASIQLRNATNDVCSGKIISHRTGANFGADLTFELSDNVDGTFQERMRITETGLIGIGTNPPSNTLHIYRNATQGALGSVNTANATVRIQDSGASMYIDGNTIATDSQGWISTIGAYDFDIATNEVSRIKVKSSGYVGIGYDAPNHPLHVLGKTRFDAYSVSDPDSGSSPYTGSHTFTYYDGIGLSVIGGQGSHTGDTLVLGQETGTSANFSFIKAISDTNGSPAVEFVVNGLGSVGIGVSSPGEALHVGGSAILDSTNANLKIKSGTTGTSGSIYWTFNTDSTVYASAGIEYDNRTTDGFLIDSGYPITLDFASSHIRFSNNGSEKARINTSGQLGIGTNAPDVLLHTVGTRAGVSSTGGSGPIAKFESEDSYIDIISTADGTWGSSVNLIEGSASLATNKDMWAMIRKTNSGGSDLNFTYGTGLNPSANTAQFTLSTSGEATFASVVNATAVNTGQGDYELYAMDQNVRTTDTPKFASLQLSAGNTPTIYFNGTNDGSDGANSDFAIKATPEGLDFYEPEDGNKIHFQILDDTGVNAVYGYQLNGTEVIDSSRNLTNIGTGNFSGAVSISGDLTLAKGTTAKQAYHDLYIGGADLAGADSSIYIGNAGDGTGYGWMMYYSGSGSGNDNKLVFVSENLGTENQVMTMVQGGSVGIGVVAPSYDLHVDGTFRASGTGSIGGPMGINDTSPEATLDVNGEVVIGTGTQAINADADLTLRNGVAFVGIDLKSARTSGNIGGLRYYGTASDSVPTAQFLVETDGSYHFYNGTSGAQDRVTINSDGKIGVGTTTVSAMLHLHGNTNTWATSPTIVMSSSSTANANIRNWRIGPADTNYGNFHIGVSSAQGALVDSTGEAQTFTIDYNSNIGLGTAAPSQKLHVHGASAHLNFTGGNNRILYNGYRALEGSTDGATLQLGENYSKTVLYNNVGIGNTNPGNPLSIKKVTTTNGTTGTTFIELHNDVGADLNQEKTFIDFIFEDDNDNDWPQVRIGAEVGQNNNSDSTLKEGSGAFVVYTNNASTNSPGSPSALNEKFRVDYAGNVGIGTNAPTYKLDVNGGIQLNGKSALTNNGYFIGAPSYGFRWNNNADTFNNVIMYDNGNMYVRGSVGIGTNAPDGDLHIYGNATQGTIRIGGGNGSGNSRIFIQSNGDDSYIDSYGDNAYKHLYIQANRLLLNTAANTGNVGIGTTNPVSPLHINKSGTSNVQEILLTLMSDTSNRPVLQFSEGGAGITGGQSIEYNGMGSGDTNYIAINSVTGASMFEFYSGGNSTFKGAQHYYGTEDANNGTTTLVLRNYDSTLVGAGDIQGRIQFTGRYWSNSTSQLVESRIEHGHQLGDGNGGSFLRFLTQVGGDSPVEQMRIDRNGSVGIGTTSPAEALHVYGKTYIENNDTTAQLYIRNFNNANGAKINFSDLSSSYAQTGTIEYNHADSNSFGAGNTFKFYGSETAMSFHVSGFGLFTGDVTAYYSDMRLKTKLDDIEGSLDKISGLNGFYYEPNEKAIELGYKKERRVGLSAQDVQKVLPEAVSPAAIDPEYMSVDYAKLVPLLVEGIKELKSEVDSLKQTIKDLQK